ncbi:uncharacterized protein [Leptinotarsa decemlineata]|uniref:uncharacterized protein n=1 Tax=Leptinotarsa decemlineata TaxID=7539 RepID=UPI003D3086EC
MKYNDCRGMDDYLNKNEKSAQQLKANDHEIKYSVLAALIFVSFPDYYKLLFMALENCGAQLTTNLVKERLSAEAVKFENSKKEPAFLMKKGPVKKMFKGKCYICHRVGHLSKDCRYSKRSEKTNVAHANESGLIIHSSVLGIGNLNPNDWYIDSGASVHDSDRKDWLKNLNSVENKNLIVTASGEKFDIEENGETTVLLNVNGYKVKTPIRDISYAPGLEFNLISCRQLGRKE